MLGRAVNTPAYLMFPQVSERKDNVEGFVAELVQSVQKAHEVAPSNLKTATKRMKCNNHLRILQRTDAVKALVYILDKASVKGECKKLGIVWKGPGNKTVRIPLQSEASECTYGSKPRYDQIMQG